MTFTTHPSPAFQITVDNQDITGKLTNRLISLTLTECASEESDQLDLVLSDADGLLAIPPRGIQINLSIGWSGTGLIDKGSFTVDEVEHCGAPDVITIRARTANLINNFRNPIEESYDQTTLGEILEKIAARNHLKLGMTDELHHIRLKHIDQTRESDAAFLRRLGKKYDAAATVKNNTLLFMPASKAKTSSGQDLPIITITRQSGDRHRYHTAERDAYSGVQAYWHDEHAGMQRSVIVGTDDNCKRLRTTYANEADARTAALAEWGRLQRGIATFEMALALGNVTLMPLSPAKVIGFKTSIDQVDWIVSKVTHNISPLGFTTHIECETRIAKSEWEEEVNPEPERPP